jgi:hypothetical protein
LTAPANATPAQPYLTSAIAGSVLPISRAEELLATLPGVIAARIIAGPTGEVDEIHVLTTTEYTPKQTVRNVESALIAHLGMRVDHRKISVATSADTPSPRVSTERTAAVTPDAPPASAATAARAEDVARRVLYFEDVEVRRSRLRGVTCRVTLRKGDDTLAGEAEGHESDRSRIDLAARATLIAIGTADDPERGFALEGVKLIDAFERAFVFVGVTARHGRTTTLLTGSCEIKDSAETASALAVLDATNRWIAPGR